MDKHLNVLHQALNKANQSGTFTLQESAMVARALDAVTQQLQGNSEKGAIVKDSEVTREEKILKAIKP